jgi:hypothetical protein
MLIMFKISDLKWVKIFAILGVGLSAPLRLEISGSATDYANIKSYGPIQSQLWPKKEEGKSATAGIL